MRPSLSYCLAILGRMPSKPAALLTLCLALLRLVSCWSLPMRERPFQQMVQREEARVRAAKERQQIRDKPERDQSEQELQEYRDLRRQEWDLMATNPDNLDEDEVKRQIEIR